MKEMPELREGPPWAMEDMILVQPALVAPILASAAAAHAAALVRAAAHAGEPVVLTGCGTSEHAAMAGAAMMPHARSRDAFEAALDPQSGGVLIAVSHEAGTVATLAALRAAAANGARTILITALPDRVAAALARGAPPALDGAAGVAPLVVATPLRDRSWCHTVGYLSPLLALTAIAGAADAATAGRVIAGVLRRRHLLAAAALVLAGCKRLIVAASGVDEVTARELALKIEEGVHIPTTPLGLEKLLHGHLPAADARTGLIVLRADPSAAERRDRRARDVLAAVAVLGMPAVTIDGLPDGHALLAGAVAAQLLTLELALAAGTNPDLIRREQDAYRAAAAAADGA